jgi:hypothetical protein
MTRALTPDVAALKGEWEVLPPAALEGRGLCDIGATYSRLEYAGAPTPADVTRATQTEPAPAPEPDEPDLTLTRT